MRQQHFYQNQINTLLNLINQLPKNHSANQNHKHDYYQKPLQFNIIVLGHKLSGKTSLIKNLIESFNNQNIRQIRSPKIQRFKSQGFITNNPLNYLNNNKQIINHSNNSFQKFTLVLSFKAQNRFFMEENKYRFFSNSSTTINFYELPFQYQNDSKYLKKIQQSILKNNNNQFTDRDIKIENCNIYKTKLNNQTSRMIPCTQFLYQFTPKLLKFHYAILCSSLINPNPILLSQMVSVCNSRNIGFKIVFTHLKLFKKKFKDRNEYEYLRGLQLAIRPFNNNRNNSNKGNQLYYCIQCQNKKKLIKNQNYNPAANICQNQYKENKKQKYLNNKNRYYALTLLHYILKDIENKYVQSLKQIQSKKIKTDWFC